MVRCKIKGTGKKRNGPDASPPPPPQNVLPDHLHSTDVDTECVQQHAHAAIPLVSPSYETATVQLPEGWDCPDEALFDGDLVFFDGSPFHFLDPDQQQLNRVPFFPLLPSAATTHNEQQRSTTLTMRTSTSPRNTNSPFPTTSTSSSFMTAV